MSIQDPDLPVSTDPDESEQEAAAKARSAGMRMMLVTLAVTAVAVTLLGRLLAPLQPECVNTVIDTVPSPDAAWNAILFERNCGSEAGFTTQVSLMQAGFELPDLAGNAFVAADGDTAGSTAWGGPEATLAWTDERQVQITFDSTARVTTRSESVGEVSISFVEAADTN